MPTLRRRHTRLPVALMAWSFPVPVIFSPNELYAPSTRRPTGMKGRWISSAAVPLYPSFAASDRSLMGWVTPPATPIENGLTRLSCASETRGATTRAIAAIARNSERFKASPCSRMRPQVSREAELVGRESCLREGFALRGVAYDRRQGRLPALTDNQTRQSLGQ